MTDCLTASGHSARSTRPQRKETIGARRLLRARRATIIANRSALRVIRSEAHGVFSSSEWRGRLAAGVGSLGVLGVPIVKKENE